MEGRSNRACEDPNKVMTEAQGGRLQKKGRKEAGWKPIGFPTGRPHLITCEEKENKSFGFGSKSDRSELRRLLPAAAGGSEPWSSATLSPSDRVPVVCRRGGPGPVGLGGTERGEHHHGAGGARRATRPESAFFRRRRDGGL